MRLGFFLALFLLSVGIARAQDAASASEILVLGDLPSTGTLKLADLQALATIEATWRHDDETHQVRGVLLETILAKFGFDSGPHGRELKNNAERRNGWRRVLVASAPDGFQAVFSCAELFAEIGPSQVLLVWEMDSKPLPLETGPLRLVALTDKKGSRSIRQVCRLEVVDMRRIVSPMPGSSEHAR